MILPSIRTLEDMTIARLSNNFLKKFLQFTGWPNKTSTGLEVFFGENHET